MMADISDEEIFRLIITEHNQEAYHALFDRYWKKLYVKAYVRLQNEEEAKDCVQNVFLSIWNRRTITRVPDSVEAYLSTCIRNTVLNHLKSSKARLAREEEFLRKPENSSDPSQTLEFRELRSLIDSEVQKMPEKMRQVFLLSREYELSGTEIAEQLDLSPQTVRNQITLALKRLRQKVQYYGFS